MNLLEIKKKIEEQFVEDYKDLLLFMKQINETLEKFNIDSRYDDYNNFCLDIEKHILNFFKINNDLYITPELMSKVLNNMIKQKILEDPKHEEKLSEYFKDENDLDMNNFINN